MAQLIEEPHRRVPFYLALMILVLGACKNPTVVTETPPTVVTGTVSNITPDGATISADVASKGSSDVTARGLCHSETSNPTMTDTCVDSGIGMGTFTVTLTDLSLGVRYYARPYAINAAGTAFGNQVSFIPGFVPPIVITGTAGNVTANSATVVGNVTDSGGAPVTGRGVCYAKTQHPTIVNSCISSGSGTGSFVVNISNLFSGTTFYVRTYVANAHETVYGNEVSFTTLTYFTNGGGVTDIDGNTYATVIINGQEWMAENLKTTRYNNGEVIPNVTDSVAWIHLDTGAWVNYKNLSDNDAVYGKLYNWHAVNNSMGLCPTGWHVPTDAEWTAMTGVFGSNIYVNTGGKLKATTHWRSPNTGATNESGFSGIPGGGRKGGHGTFGSGYSTFVELGSIGYWWSSTQGSGTNNGRIRHLNYNSGDVFRTSSDKRDGFSVRCMRGDS